MIDKFRIVSRAPEELIALVSDLPSLYPVPAFGHEDVVGLADFLETDFPFSINLQTNQPEMGGICEYRKIYHGRWA